MELSAAVMDMAVRAGVKPAQGSIGVSPFDAWLPTVSPSFDWHWQHLAFIREHLDRVTTGEVKRLMLFLPPRHGKSEMTTVRYSAWRLERNPSERVIIGAYNQILANKFSRKARRIAQGRIEISSDRKAVEDWETPQGGGLRAVGVGGGITGQGGNLIVIDDPVKSREEAESETYRERVWEWYKDDLYTRLEPGGSIILIMTRWHEDDLAGKLLEEAKQEGERWEVVSLPALAEPGDALDREIGEPLCPERYTLEALENIRAVLGERSFTALYQQRPTAREGNLFKLHQLPIMNAAPAGPEIKRIRYWDLGGSDSKKADYSVGCLMSKSPDGLFYIEDIKRGQWSPKERNEHIRATAEADVAKFGSMTTWIEKVPGLAVEVIDNIVRYLAGYTVHTEMAKNDKVTRADPLASQCEANNVRVVEGAWNAAYREEMTSFPHGKNDDQVDASSGAFSKLAKPKEWMVY